MRTLFCFLLFVSVAFSQEIKQPVIIPFTLTDQGHVLLKAKVNGIEGTFIFDTGAGLNLVTKKFADKVATLTKTNEFYTGHRATGEAITTDLWQTKSIEMGGFKTENQLMAMLDIDFPIDGLISLLPFKDNAITIDYKNKVLTVESQKSLAALAKTGKTIAIQPDDEHGKTLGIFTYIKLDDKITLQISLDSGAGFNVFRFNSRYMEALGIDPNTVEKTYRASDFDPKSGNNYFSAQVKSIAAGDNATLKKDGFKATFIEGLIYQGIASINWLGDKITIDIRGERIVVN